MDKVSGIRTDIPDEIELTHSDVSSMIDRMIDGFEVPAEETAPSLPGRLRRWFGQLLSHPPKKTES